MRWLVEVSSLGISKADLQKVCVEAESWQRALQAARAQRGEDGPMSGFSIELLEEGYRAVDPLSRVRFVVRRAPDDMPVSQLGPIASKEPKGIAPAAPNAAAHAAATNGHAGTSNGTADARSLNATSAAVAVAVNEPASADATTPDLPPSPSSSAPSAPDEADEKGPPRPRPVAPAMGGASAASSEPQAVEPAAKKAATMMFGSVGEAGIASASHATSHVASQAEDRPLPEIGSAIPGLPSTSVLSSRAQNPRDGSPLTYREYAFVVPQGTSEELAADVLRAQLRYVEAHLATAKAGKLVNLAAFDVAFAGKPPVPPLATLMWKDWKAEPVIAFPRRSPATASKPPAAPSATPGSSSSSASASSSTASSGSSASSASTTAPTSETSSARNGDAPGEATAAPSASTKRPSAPTLTFSSSSEAARAPSFEPPKVDAPTAQPVPAEAARVEAARAEAARVEAARVEAARVEAARVEAAAAPASSPISSQPDTAPSPPVAAGAFPSPAAVSPAPIVAPAASLEARPVGAAAIAIAAAPATLVDAPAAHAAAAPSAEPTASASQPPPAGMVRTPSGRFVRGRVSGDELITSLFESMHDLHFLRDALDGGQFCLGLVTEVLPSRAGFIHFFDIERREWVLACTRGKDTQPLLAMRCAEADPILRECTRRRRAFVVDDASTTTADRYVRLGGGRSLIASPIMQAGRALGAIEIVNPLDGMPFTEDEGNAMTYIAEQYAEFLGSRGIVLDRGRIQAAARAR